MRGPGERIEDKKLARVVWAVVGLSIALQLTGSILDSVQGSSDDTSPIESLAMFIAFATFPVVGAILVSRGQRHALSWVMIAIGVLSSAGVFAMTYAHRALVLDPGSLPGGTFAAWIEASFWLPLLELIVLFLVMFFPDGKLVSRRWRPLLWVSSALLVVSTLAPMFQARLATDSYDIANPVGVSFIESIESIGWMLVLLGLTGIGALASLIVRFHRSQGVERLQMKWFTFAAGGMVTGVVVGDLLGLPDYLFAFVVVSLPVSMGVAILKYRLYEIDVIINRALVYGALTSMLVLAYLGLVFALQLVLEPLTEKSDLAIAGSTLAVAALIRPLRARTQAFIDRRFYRSKYNATRALTIFSARLRDEVDLDVVQTDVLTVLNETIQPKHASVWLRPEGAGR